MTFQRAFGGGRTNSIKDPRWEAIRAVALAVREYEAMRNSKKRKGIRFALQATTECKKCHRRMLKKYGDLQIANKMRGAPICIPCIIGIKRRKEPLDLTSNWSKETKERFLKTREEIRNRPRINKTKNEKVSRRKIK